MQYKNAKVNKTIMNYHSPAKGPEIFLHRLKKFAYIPDNVFICNPSLIHIAEMEKSNPDKVLARMDGTYYFEFSGDNFLGLVKQRRPRLFPYVFWLYLLPFQIKPMTILLNRFFNRGAIRLTRIADAIVFQSFISKSMHKEFLKYQEGRIPDTIIYNGADIEEYYPRKGCSLEGYPSVIISASVYRLHKRLREAIKLVNHLSEEYPDIRLHILGEFDPLVQKSISGFDMSRCVLHGRKRLRELPEFYAGADIQLSMCIFDPCPNVVCEGLASGLPVITPFESGASELVGKENADWTVREDLELKYRPMQVINKTPGIPIDKYEKVFHKIMDNLPGEKEKARFRAEKEINIRTTAKKYEKFIQKSLVEN